MAKIFLSHSSVDDAAAIALSGWLESQGWDDQFLDLDSERGIAAGERWERALSEAAQRCEAVVFLVSRAWLDSAWCRREFHLAQRLNKRIFGVLIADVPPANLPRELTETWQLVGLAGGTDHVVLRSVDPRTGREQHVTFSAAGLRRLRVGLERAGLDPRFFAWPPAEDPQRAPYRGLRPLESDDAGIFFGREAAIIEGLDRLRGLRDAAAPRLFVIIGASGAGKSSYLRAGLLPRLLRDDRHFRPLPPIRPDRAALFGDTGLVAALTTAFRMAARPQSRAEIRDAVAAGADAVGAVLRTLVAPDPALAADRVEPLPTVVLCIDQAEELFRADGAEEAHAFLTLLRGLASLPDPAVIVVFTIRSDAYEALQNAGELEGLRQVPFSLPPLPRGAYKSVIEGPAHRFSTDARKLAVEPALTDALLADIEAGGAKDALPLLAFTLERLFRDYGDSGVLRLENYQRLGRIQGSIDASVAQAMAAADADPRIPRDPETRRALIRRGLIPWLAGIDPDTGAPRRRVARWEEIPEEARPLIGHLVDARLLSTDIDADSGARTIEPAHEALLRQWGLLQGWLDEAFADLTTAEGVKRAARDWEANARDGGWLSHTAGRLEDAERLRLNPDMEGFLTTADWAYVAACRTAEDRRRNRELDDARRIAEEASRRATAERLARSRTMAGLVVAMLLLFVAGAAGFYAFTTANEAERQAKAALQNQRNAMVSFALTKIETDTAGAIGLVLAAWPETADGPFPTLLLAHTALSLAFADLASHDGQVNAVGFSPDGNRVVSGGADGTLRLWDAKTGAALITPLRGHLGQVYGVAFSPDGKRIVSGAEDGTLRLWDAETGAPLGQPLRGHDAAVTSVAFSPDGKRIVSGGWDYAIRLWDAETGAPWGMPFEGHDDWVRSVAFSPDGKQIVSGSDDGTVRLWDAETGLALREPMRGHTGYVTSVAYSPDGKRIASGGDDETVRLWDAATGAALGDPLLGHEMEVTSLAFSPDGARVVSGSWDDTLRLWDAETGAALGAPLQGHSATVTSVAFSPDGRRIVSGDWDGVLRQWDADKGATPGGSLDRHGDSVRSVAVSPDGNRIVSASADNTLRLWDAETGAPLGEPLTGHQDWVRTAAFSPDGKHIVSGSDDGTLRLWDARTGAPLGDPWQGHDAWIVSVAYSPDGKRVVSASDDNTLRLWDAETGAPLGAALRGHTDAVTGVAFSPDGKRIVSGSSDGTLRLWDADTGQALGDPLRGHEGAVLTVAFSPDGRHLASGGEDLTLRLWDATTGAALGKPLRGHDYEVRSVAFSPDGTRLVSGSFDDSLRLWDVGSGAGLGVVGRQKDGVNSVAFTPDGTRIFSGGGDGTILVLYNLPPGNILQLACRYLPRINGRPTAAIDEVATELGMEGLSLPQDCETYDPPLPPLPAEKAG